MDWGTGRVDAPMVHSSRGSRGAISARETSDSSTAQKNAILAIPTCPPTPLSFTPGARDEPASQARAQPRERASAGCIAWQRYEYEPLHHLPHVSSKISHLTEPALHLCRPHATRAMRRSHFESTATHQSQPHNRQGFLQTQQVQPRRHPHARYQRS